MSQKRNYLIVMHLRQKRRGRGQTGGFTHYFNHRFVVNNVTSEEIDKIVLNESQRCGLTDENPSKAIKAIEISSNDLPLFVGIKDYNERIVEAEKIDAQRVIAETLKKSLTPAMLDALKDTDLGEMVKTVAAEQEQAEKEAAEAAEAATKKKAIKKAKDKAKKDKETTEPAKA